jgi:hypothetical protein
LPAAAGFFRPTPKPSARQPKKDRLRPLKSIPLRPSTLNSNIRATSIEDIERERALARRSTQGGTTMFDCRLEHIGYWHVLYSWVIGLHQNSVIGFSSIARSRPIGIGALPMYVAIVRRRGIIDVAGLLVAPE